MIRKQDIGTLFLALAFTALAIVFWHSCEAIDEPKGRMIFSKD